MEGGEQESGLVTGGKDGTAGESGDSMACDNGASGEDSGASDDEVEQDMDESDAVCDTNDSGTDSESEKIETEIVSELYDNLNNYSITF